MKYKILIVVFTDIKNQIDNLKKYAYYTTDESIKIGDHFKSSRDGRMVQVVSIKESETPTFNGKTLNKLMKMDESKNKMIAGIKEKYLSQYVPERVPNAKMAADGSICVLIGGEYIGMKGEELTSYPEEMVMDVPVYSITKPQSKVQVGEIVISGKSFGKVISKNPDGSLKILSFSGYTHNKKEIKDFMLGQATVRVLVNYFDSANNGFNPIMFALAQGDSLNINTLMMMQMMPGSTKDNNPMADILKNPMMMAMLMKNGESSKGGNDIFEYMMVMGMMGGNNPFNKEPEKVKETVTEIPTPTPVSSPESDIIKSLLESDPEFKEAFIKAMKKSNQKGDE